MRLFALCSAAGMAINPLAPAGAVQAGKVPQVWQADWQNSHCTISTGDPASAFLSVWMTPGDPSPDLYIVGPAGMLRTRGADGRLVLNPGGEGFTAKLIERAGRPGAKVVEFFDLKEKFPAAFSNAAEVRVTSLRRPLVVPVTGAAKAMAALRQCIDEKLTAWGIDAEAYEALRSPPIDPGHAGWFSADDYPEDAQRAGYEGDVVARLDVDAKGKVTACAVLVSSGMESIDKVTCAKTLKNGKFLPAIGADGRPAAAVRTIFARFRLEG